MIEFGVEWRSTDGKTHIGGEYTLDGARRMLAGAGDRKKWDPYAARVVERDVSDWRDAAEMPAAQGDSTPRRQSRSAKLGGAPRQGLDDPAATTCPSSELTGKEPLSS